MHMQKDNIAFTQAQREDGKHGILILKQISDVNRKVLIFSDDYNSVVVMTCNLMYKKWRSKVHSKELLDEDLPLENQIEYLIEETQ